MAERIVIPGDAGGMEAVAGQLRTAAGDVAAVRDRVASNGLEGGWSGAAADAFRSTLRQLPGELTKIVSAFEQAGSAVAAFASRLSQLQQEAAWYNNQLAQSEEEQRIQQQRMRSVELEVSRARAAHSSAVDPATLLHTRSLLEAAERAAHGVNAALHDTGATFERLMGNASELRHEYEAAVEQCAGDLDHARHDAVHTLGSWLHHELGSIGHSVKSDGAAIFRWGGRELHDAEHDGDHLLKWAGNEFDKHWEQVRTVLEDAALAIAAVGVVALTGGAAAPLMLGIGVAAVADSGLILEGDAIGADRGSEKDRKRLFGDTFDVLTSVLSVGTSSALMGAKDASKLSDADKVAERLGAGPIESKGINLLSKSGWGSDLVEDFKGDSTAWQAAGSGAHEIAKDLVHDTVDHEIDHLSGAPDEPFKPGWSKLISPPSDAPMIVRVPIGVALSLP